MKMKKKCLLILCMALAVCLLSSCTMLPASMLDVMFRGNNSTSAGSGNSTGDGDTVTISREEYEQYRQFDELLELMASADVYFYQEPDHEKMLQEAAAGLLRGLEDDYTFYYNPEEWEKLWEEDEGEYTGIGVLISSNYVTGICTISRVFKGSPAEKAGVQRGDILFKVNQTVYEFIPWDTKTDWKEKALNNLYYYVSDFSATYGAANTLFMLAGVMILFTALKTSCYFGSNAVMIPISTGVVKEIRCRIYNKILSLPIGFFTEERKGDIIARITGDVSEVENSIIASLSMLIKDPILILIYFGFLTWLSPEMMVFTIVFAPAFVWIMGIIGKQLKRSSLEAQALWSDTMSQVDETLGGLRVIKAFNAEKAMRRRFQDITDRMRRKVSRVSIRQATAHPVSEFLGTVMLMIVLCVGGIMIISGKSLIGSGKFLDAPQFIYFLVILYSVIEPIKELSRATYGVRKGLASMERINKILEAENPIQDPSNPLELKGFEKSIRLEDVSFTYDGTKQILSHVNLEIPRGKMIAIVGESGAGKTNVICDLALKFTSNNTNYLPYFYSCHELYGSIVNNIKEDFNLNFTRQHTEEQIIKRIADISNKETIIFFDAIDENNAQDFTIEINNFVRIAKDKNIKICFTCKDIEYNRFLNIKGNPSFIANNVFSANENKISFVINNFSDNEYRKILSTYREKFDLLEIPNEISSELKNPGKRVFFWRQEMKTISTTTKYLKEVSQFYSSYCHKDNTVLYESAEIVDKSGVQSLIGISPALKISCEDLSVKAEALNQNGAALLKLLGRRLGCMPQDRVLIKKYERPDLSVDEYRRLTEHETPLSVMHELQQLIKTCSEIFIGGYIAFDYINNFENLGELPKGVNPCSDYCFYVFDLSLRSNHQKAQTGVYAFIFDDSLESEYQALLNELTEQIEGFSCVSDTSVIKPVTPEYHPDLDDRKFGKIISAIKDHVIRGDAFQVVPSRTFSHRCTDPFKAYSFLKRINPSPYMYYIRDPAFTLFGASPEYALRYEASNREVSISPIAGTRPRGVKEDGTIDRELDTRIELDLRTDKKETAEHLMLVDLARNDLARISKPGSRYVENMLHVDKYQSVMHLVSDVHGTLLEGLNAVQAYTACMNMGTLSGAPKVKAHEIIYRYEKKKRGTYGGVIGILSADGSIDTCITIRSAFVMNNTAYVQAGCGVVFDSNVEAECKETVNKAKSVLIALALAEENSNE